MTTERILARELEVGMKAIEHRLVGPGFQQYTLRIVWTDAAQGGRFVHYDLEDGSERVLSPYIEVAVLR